MLDQASAVSHHGFAPPQFHGAAPTASINIVRPTTASQQHLAVSHDHPDQCELAAFRCRRVETPLRHARTAINIHKQSQASQFRVCSRRSFRFTLSANHICYLHKFHVNNSLTGMYTQKQKLQRMRACMPSSLIGPATRPWTRRTESVSQLSSNCPSCRKIVAQRHADVLCARRARKPSWHAARAVLYTPSSTIKIESRLVCLGRKECRCMHTGVECSACQQPTRANAGVHATRGTTRWPTVTYHPWPGLTCSFRASSRCISLNFRTTA